MLWRLTCWKRPQAIYWLTKSTTPWNFATALSPAASIFPRAIIDYVLQVGEGRPVPENEAMVIRAGIVGGSGYAGGELLRLLLGHPHVEVVQVTSQRYAGRYVYGVHPNLRGATSLKFSAVEDLAACDLLFLALPHGRAAEQIEQFAASCRAHY